METSHLQCLYPFNVCCYGPRFTCKQKYGHGQGTHQSSFLKSHIIISQEGSMCWQSFQLSFSLSLLYGLYQGGYSVQCLNRNFSMWGKHHRPLRSLPPPPFFFTCLLFERWLASEVYFYESQCFSGEILWGIHLHVVSLSLSLSVGTCLNTLPVNHNYDSNFHKSWPITFQKWPL